MMRFNFDAPDCTCGYKDGIVARNMCGHVPPCPVYARWYAEFNPEGPEPTIHLNKEASKTFKEMFPECFPIQVGVGIPAIPVE